MNNIQINVFVGRLLEEVLGPVKNGEDVRWCVWTEKRKVPLLSTLCYGNESTAWTVVIAFNLHVLFVFTMIFSHSDSTFCFVVFLLNPSYTTGFFRFKEYMICTCTNIYTPALFKSCFEQCLYNPYSLDLRWRIVLFLHQISQDSCVYICESSIRRYLSVFEQTGYVKPV